MPKLHAVVNTSVLKPAGTAPDGRTMPAYLNWSVFDRDTMQREFINVYFSSLPPAAQDRVNWEGQEFEVPVIKGKAYKKDDGNLQSTFQILPGAPITLL